MDPAEEFFRNLKQNMNLIKIGLVVLVLTVLGTGGTFIIPPGHRGVLVTMGKVSPVFAPEGLGFKLPW